MPTLKTKLRPETWRRHADIVAERTKAAALHAPTACAVLGCGRRTRASEGRGFGKHCQKHFDALTIHGSYERGTITSPVLRPFRQQAEMWLRRNSGRPEVAGTLTELAGLFYVAGQQPRQVGELVGMDPKDKAWNILSHLRTKGITAKRIAAIYMAVRMIVENDNLTDRSAIYRRVQIAKALHRLMPGKHVMNPHTGKAVSSKFSPSRGVKMRHLGRIVEGACRGLDGFVAEVFKEADERAGRCKEMATAMAVLRCGVTTVMRRGRDGVERPVTIRTHFDGSPMKVPVSPRKKVRTKPWRKGSVGRPPRPKPEKPAPFNVKGPSRREQYWWEAHPPKPGTPAAAQMMREVEALCREAHARWLEAREAAKAEADEGQSG